MLLRKSLCLYLVCVILAFAGCNDNNNNSKSDVIPHTELTENKSVLHSKMTILDSFEESEIQWNGEMQVHGNDCYTYSVFVLMTQDDGEQEHREMRLEGIYAIEKQAGYIYTSVDGEVWDEWAR